MAAAGHRGDVRFGDVAPWIFRLTSSDGDDFRADERECGPNQDIPESEESPLRAADAVELRKRSRVLPVTEAETVMIWSSTEVEHDAKDDEASDGEHLDRGEDEFRLAVCLCGAVSTITRSVGAVHILAPNKLIMMTMTRKIVIHAASFTFVVLSIE